MCRLVRFLIVPRIGRRRLLSAGRSGLLRSGSPGLLAFCPIGQRCLGGHLSPLVVGNPLRVDGGLVLRPAVFANGDRGGERRRWWRDPLTIGRRIGARRLQRSDRGLVRRSRIGSVITLPGPLGPRSSRRKAARQAPGRVGGARSAPPCRSSRSFGPCVDGGSRLSGLVGRALRCIDRSTDDLLNVSELRGRSRMDDLRGRRSFCGGLCRLCGLLSCDSFRIGMLGGDPSGLLDGGAFGGRLS